MWNSASIVTELTKPSWGLARRPCGRCKLLSCIRDRLITVTSIRISCYKNFATVFRNNLFQYPLIFYLYLHKKNPCVRSITIGIHSFFSPYLESHSGLIAQQHSVLFKNLKVCFGGNKLSLNVTFRSSIDSVYSVLIYENDLKSASWSWRTKV